MGLFSAIRRWRQERMLKRYAIPEALWREALAALPFLQDWPAEKHAALRIMTVLFLCEKNVVGARGFRVTPFQRVVVAIQACVPVLNIGLDFYDDFKTVVLCSDEFITDAEWEDEDGVVHRDEGPLLGEAMPGGPVVLSWPDALGSSERGDEAGVEDGFPDDPMPINVVIHEFVHKIDMKNGDANGCPPLSSEIAAQRWQKTMRDAYADFCKRVDAGEETGIDAYAAENPAEFFAVLSEVFFVAPALLRETYPEVYDCFRLFYRQDPGNYFSDARI